MMGSVEGVGWDGKGPEKDATLSMKAIRISYPREVSAEREKSCVASERKIRPSTGGEK
jgi:hypothetical protein